MADPATLPPKLQAPLESLDEGEEEQYIAVLLDRTRPASRVADALTRAGFPVSATTIKDLRRREAADV